MPLQPGSRIGSYEVLSPLGAGGMGEVYRAHDSHLGRDVALKTLPEAFVTDPERVARFEREARILATLNHPNIATLFGFEKQSGVLAIVMELVEGEALNDYLLRTTAPGCGLPLAEVISIARRLVHARLLVRMRVAPTRPSRVMTAKTDTPAASSIGGL